MPRDSEGAVKVKKGSALRRCLDLVRRQPVFFVLAGLVVGVVVGVPATEAVDTYFSSNEFCARTCHVMEDTVYKELQESEHWTTPSGVRPTCSDCHVSSSLTAAMWDHFISTRDLFVYLANDFSKPDAFEKFRPEAADRARMWLLSNDSKTCRTCHVMDAIRPKKKRGQRMHEKGKKEGTTCILCHYNLVHKEVEPEGAFLAALEEE